MYVYMNKYLYIVRVSSYKKGCTDGLCIGVLITLNFNYENTNCFLRYLNT